MARRIGSCASPSQRRRSSLPTRSSSTSTQRSMVRLSGEFVPLFAHAPVLAADAPSKDIHAFIGTFTINTPPSVSSNEVPMVQVPTVEPLSAENVLWANTVLAAGSAIGFVVYTGPETRAVMNTSHPKTKVGLLDLEISQLAKVCHSRSCQAQHVSMYERRFCAPCHSRCPSRWLH